jgi:hypothetical protein
MAMNTPKMGLATWDKPIDPYDYIQLTQNWNKVDFHDHTPGRGVPIPKGGIAAGAVGLTEISSEVALMPSGLIVLWPYQGSSYSGQIPAGFLACDGSSYAQSSYPTLYALIGTTFGPNPPVSGQFAVPALAMSTGVTNLVWVIKT